MKTIERLKALLAKATGGTWRGEVDDPYTLGAVTSDTEGLVANVTVCFNECEDEAVSTTELVAASHNALPALLAVVEAQQREIENAREFRRRCCEYTLSYLDAKGERVMDMEQRLIAGYCKLKDNTDDARRKLDEVTP